ncbi:MAG: hypothetical protein ACO2ZM_02675 [Francisellaceae bacterium]
MPKKLFKRFLLIFIACLLFALALLGAVLPILPGFVFFFAGIIVLSWASPLVERWFNRLLRPHPRLHGWIIQAENKLKKWFRIKDHEDDDENR